MSAFYVNLKIFLLVLTIFLFFTIFETSVGCYWVGKPNLIQEFSIVDLFSNGKVFPPPLLTWFHFLNCSKQNREETHKEMAIIKYEYFIKFTKWEKV